MFVSDRRRWTEMEVYMKLIINGDDFGITHACNLAIIDCFHQGVMTSASMMTNMPYAKEAAQLWKENPQLSVGLHLNLTVGYPLCKNIKTLLKEDGTFNKKILNATAKEVNKEEIWIECSAQMQKFIELTGRKPDHINSHHGIEAIPGGADVLQNLAKQYDLPIRQLTHVTNLASFEYTTNYIIPLKRFSITPPQDPKEIIALFSNEDIQSDNYYEWLGHPGYIDWDLIQLSSLTTGRCADANCFCSPIIKDWIKENNIELISYLDLPKK